MSTPIYLLIKNGLIGIDPSPNFVSIASVQQDDWNPNDWSVKRGHQVNITGTLDPIVTGAERLGPIGGVIHPMNDKRITLQEADPLLLLRFAHAHTSSLINNRFSGPNDRDLLVGPGDVFRYWYDDDANLGRVAVVSRASVGPVTLASFAVAQSSVNIGLISTGFRLAKVVLFQPTVAVSLHGMEAGAGQTVFGSTTQSDAWLGHRKRKTLVNINAFALTIPDESATEATVTNRFRIGGGGPVVLSQDETAEVEYDDTILRWRVL